MLTHTHNPRGSLECVCLQAGFWIRVRVRLLYSDLVFGKEVIASSAMKPFRLVVEFQIAYFS